MKHTELFWGCNAAVSFSNDVFLGSYMCVLAERGTPVPSEKL